MKTVLLLSTLFPAGLLAAFLGSNAARQEEAAETMPEPARRVKVVQAAEPVEVYSFQTEALAPVPPTPGAPMISRTIRSTSGPGTWAVQAEGLPGQGVSSPHPMTAYAFSFGSGGASESNHKAVAKLRAAKSDEDKAEAREELQAALGEEFDEFLKHQSDELDRMEKKLSNLRDQLDKRRDAKDDLISLRLQTIENEVNGLGWPAGGGGMGLFSPGGTAFGQGVPDVSFTTPAVIATPYLSPTPAGLPTIAAPAPPDEAAESEKEEPSKPRSRRSAR